MKKKKNPCSERYFLLYVSLGRQLPTFSPQGIVWCSPMASQGALCSQISLIQKSRARQDKTICDALTKGFSMISRIRKSHPAGAEFCGEPKLEKIQNLLKTRSRILVADCSQTEEGTFWHLAKDMYVWKKINKCSVIVIANKQGTII